MRCQRGRNCWRAEEVSLGKLSRIGWGMVRTTSEMEEGNGPTMLLCRGRIIALGNDAEEFGATRRACRVLEVHG